MNSSSHSRESRRGLACFKCTEGCVHLEYGNLMLTFEQDQFLAFSEVITEMRRRLLAERETLKPQNTDSITATDTFIM